MIIDEILDIVKIRILSNNDNNNSLLNILYLLFLSLFFSFIFKIKNNYIYINFELIKQYLYIYLLNKRKNSIILNGKLLYKVNDYSYSQEIKFSPKMEAFWDYLHNITNNNYINVKEEFTDIKEHNYSLLKDNKKSYIINQYIPFKIENNLYVKCSIIEKTEILNNENINNNNITKIKINDVKIELYSFHYNINYLQTFIDNIYTKMCQTLENNEKDKLNIYSLISVKNDPIDILNSIEYTKSNFISNKTFNNTFFEQRKELIERIDFFMNNKEWYRKMGIPYTLGIILHGPPGTGKTSIIKCVGNYMKRHLVNIDLNIVKNNFDFNLIFSNNNYCNKYINENKRIFILEDIDCMNDIIKKRNENNENNQTNYFDFKKIIKDDITNNVTNNNNIINNEFKKNKENKQKNTLTLSHILNVIDGLKEGNGRVLIMTTNHYKNIDDAIIRPGRIDINLEIRKANHTVIKELYYFLYKETIDETNLNTIKEYKFSCADLFNIYFNSKNKHEFINKIIH